MLIHYLKDQSSIELPEGSTAKDLADKLNLKGPHQALGASINGKTVDLSILFKMAIKSLFGILMIRKEKKFSGILLPTFLHKPFYAFGPMPNRPSDLQSKMDFTMISPI